MSAPMDTTGAAAAPLKGNEPDAPCSYHPLCIYWGVGEEQIVLQAKELQTLVRKWSVCTPQNEPQDGNRPHETENLTNAFYSLCWATKFGAPYPLAWVRRMQRTSTRVCEPLWLKRLDKTQSPINNSGYDLPAPDTGGAGRKLFSRRKFQDWLLLCDADTGEGVDVDIGQIQRMATSAEQDKSPSLRIVVNLPSNALRFTMEVVGHGIPWVCEWQRTTMTLENLRAGLTYFNSMTEQDLGDLRALLEAVVVMRDGVATVMGLLAGGFVEQIADEVLAEADREGEEGVMSSLVLVNDLSGYGEVRPRRHTKKKRQLENFQQKIPSNDHPLLRRIEELLCRAERSSFRPAPADVQELQQLMPCASEEIQLLREEVDGMLVRLTRLGFFDASRRDAHAGETDRRPRQLELFSISYRLGQAAILCGFKELLCCELVKREDEDVVRGRWAPDFDEETLKEWCALIRKETTSWEEGKREQVGSTLLDQLRDILEKNLGFCLELKNRAKKWIILSRREAARRK